MYEDWDDRGQLEDEDSPEIFVKGKFRNFARGSSPTPGNFIYNIYGV